MQWSALALLAHTHDFLTVSVFMQGPTPCCEYNAALVGNCGGYGGVVSNNFFSNDMQTQQMLAGELMRGKCISE